LKSTMGLRSKLMGRNAKVLPGQINFNRSLSWDTDDSTSTGVPTPSTASMRSGSVFSTTRPNSQGSSARPTPRGSSQRRRPVVDVGPMSPTSSGSRRSSLESPMSPWTRSAPFERSKSKGGRGRNDLSHLIAPVQPWNEFIEEYAKNLVEKVGGTQEAWTDVMGLSAGEVRTALCIGMMTPRGSNKPRQMPDDIRRVVNALLNSLPPAYRDDTAKLTFALHERPFFCGALEKHVELVLWGVVAARNAWM